MGNIPVLSQLPIVSIFTNPFGSNSNSNQQHPEDLYNYIPFNPADLFKPAKPLEPIIEEQKSYDELIYIVGGIVIVLILLK